MNGSSTAKGSTTEQVVEVIDSLIRSIYEEFRKTDQGLRRIPDKADIRQAIKPFIERGELMARVDEARKTSAAALTARMVELLGELIKVEGEIPKKFKNPTLTP